MKFLRLKKADGRTTYVNAEEIVFACVDNDCIRVEFRSPSVDGDTSVTAGPFDDPQKELDELMSEEPRIGRFKNISEAVTAFVHFCNNSQCDSCPYRSSQIKAECWIRWMFDQIEDQIKETK